MFKKKEQTEPKDLLKELEPQARKHAERTAAAVLELIEALAAQKNFLDEVKPQIGRYDMPGRWRIPLELRRYLAPLPLDSGNNSLQKALDAFDDEWIG